jgi:arginine/lysine/ornithine decarboxylase
MLMPGEAAGPDDGPYLSYLRALAAWDERFPGFGHATHGVTVRNGAYWVQCLRGRFHETPRARVERYPDLVGGTA